MENLFACDENINPNLHAASSLLSSSPLKQSLSLSSKSSALSPKSSSLVSPKVPSALSTLILTPPTVVTPIKRVDSSYDPYKSPSITRLEDYLQAKEQVFLDQVRSPKKTPTKTDNTPTKTNNTPTKTASKTVRIDTSANRYRLFEKDSNRSISHDHHLTFNYSASKSAESLYRQPILKSNKPSLLTSLPSALPPTSSTTSLPSPKRKQIRLPEQFFKQDESLSRLSRCSNNTNTYTNTNSILTNDDHIDNTVKHSTSYSRYIVIIVLVSALLYTIFVNNNGNTNDTWNSNTNSNAYEIDLYHDTNNRYILDIDTIMTLDMTALIDTYFRKPMYQFINVILEDNSKALVLVKTDSVDHHDSISNYQELIMKPYTIINDIINNSEIISSSYERLYINQMNIITMLTSVVTTMHFFLKR